MTWSRPTTPSIASCTPEALGPAPPTDCSLPTPVPLCKHPWPDVAASTFPASAGWHSLWMATAGHRDSRRSPLALSGNWCVFTPTSASIYAGAGSSFSRAATVPDLAGGSLSPTGRLVQRCESRRINPLSCDHPLRGILWAWELTRSTGSKPALAHGVRVGVGNYLGVRAT